MKNIFPFLLIIFCVSKVICQSNFDAGFLPKIVLSNKVSDKINWVNSIESRAIVYDDNYQFSHNLVDVSSILSLKTNLNQSFNFGYIIRFRNEEIIHRTFQHYNFVYQFSSLKIGHRFAFEQFYQPKKQTTFRTRYRVSLEKPLNGERVDVKEFYIKLGNEYLYDFKTNDLEIRVTPNLGFKASKRDKIEFGLDYRLGRFIENATKNNLWFRTTWYISID
ncbi:DUF2490 domain-containing protein [Polaribacter glomeratus]|uniref:DUF2490 domain-containing protein n=1 Tax=Polaribacter glomeratus TaxID=102 RepID=A0A2S7WII2_9FLAO|nr:DUF2490 domain-containing protein [Polaribacter glomeratus]PQJ77419.1 hypothetical protein BTO16_16460 [Polaribacter glomeratus]TXD66005.1 DUF2490 domain-containing protein [Polaribacter glomeratus]